MSVVHGIYYIAIPSAHGFVGTGPMPLISPPFPSYLRTVDSKFKVPFKIFPKAEGLYDIQFEVESGKQGVTVHEGDVVNLSSYEGESTYWAIEKTDSDGHVKITSPDGRHWTAGEDYFTPIVLKPATGEPNQMWRLIRSSNE